MYHASLENEGRRMLALLGLGAILFALANRIRSLPRQIAGRRQKLLDIGDRGIPIRWLGFERIEHDARQEPVPNLPAG